VFSGLDVLEEIDLYDNRLGPEVEDEELKGCRNITYVCLFAKDSTVEE